jgi:hypothetical protein
MMHSPRSFTALSLAALSIAALSLAALSAGCSVTEEQVNPLRADSGAPLPDAGAEDASLDDAAPPPEPSAPKRRVLQRNPFGHVEKSENLLWDGDFEWSSPFSDQYGWLSGPPYGYSFPNVVVGARCRSGIKCARVPKKKSIVGIAVASQGEKLSASFFAHIEADTCDKIKSTISDFFDNVEPDAQVKPTATEPDEQGWCRFETVIPARSHKPFFYIENRTTADILVDDVVLERATGSSPLSSVVGPPTAEDAAALALAAEQIGKLRGPHDSPPSEAQRAYEAWKKKR